MNGQWLSCGWPRRVAGISVASKAGAASEAPSTRRAACSLSSRGPTTTTARAAWRTAPGRKQQRARSRTLEKCRSGTRARPRVTSGAQSFHPSQPAGGRHRRKLQQLRVPPPTDRMQRSVAQLLPDHVHLSSHSAASSNSPCRALTAISNCTSLRVVANRHTILTHYAQHV